MIVDDQAFVRKGICALLAEVEAIAVVGEASNGKEAVAQALALDPDVTLMDLAMPEMDGLEAIRQITARQAGARILVLTSFVSDDKVFPAIKAGALGFLLKDSEPADLIRAIKQVNRGEPSLHPSIAIKVLQELRR
ncbi:MAG: response regulator transcription factor, partial [Dehalococcoidia bacterium]|nr:response regulator transcription factor [Dehalococcoidia bacterium]